MRKGVLFVALLLLIGFVSAVDRPLGSDSIDAGDEVDSSMDVSNSYQWLSDNSENSNAALSVEEEAFAIMALINGGKSSSNLVARLIERGDDAGCWPKGNCNVKDTALTVLSLKKAGRNVDKNVNWLISNGVLIPGLTRGEWRVQVESSVGGICKFGFDGRERQFNLEGDFLRGASGEYYVDIKRDLSSSLISNEVGKEITINCEGISGAVIISLIYKEGNNFFILENEQSSIAKLKIKNGCFVRKKGEANCDYESSLYAALALVESGKSLEEIFVQPYLENSLTNNELHRSLLVKIFLSSQNEKEIYNKILVGGQRRDGSWSAGDVFTSAFAVFALKNTNEQSAVDLGLNYLTRIKRGDGSWNLRVRDTAMALIALEGRIQQGSVLPGQLAVGKEICDNLEDDDDDNLVDCGDSDCESSEICIKAIEKVEICDDEIDNDDDGQIDCEDLACFSSRACKEEDAGEEDGLIEEEGAPEEEEEEKSLWWLWLIILLLLIGGGILFYLKVVKTGKLEEFLKRRKGVSFEEHVRRREGRVEVKEEKPKQQIPIRPRRPITKTIDEKEEEELERSLKEAEKILKGK